MERPDFLDKKYPDLTGSKPVERAVIKAKNDPERKFAPHARDERIQAYLDRLDDIVKDERGWELLKNKITKDLVIDTNDEDTVLKIAYGLYQSEKRMAIEQGHGVHTMEIENNGDLIEKYIGLVKEKHDIQEKTLHSWLSYLQENDAEYPRWFRYFVVRNLAKMGTLDKEKGEYSKRTEHTVAPFPEINSEALGFVYRMLTTGIGHKEFALEENDTPEEINIKKKKREELQKMIDKKDFIKLYTFAQIETAGVLNRESIKGEWVKYDQNSDHHKLEDTLRGKGTGWCTAEGSAYEHLQGGDFYVYYTKGKSGNYTEPRVAIRMLGGNVQEVRGVNHRQELEPALLDIAREQYQAFPGGEKFYKKSADMKKMTELVKKQDLNEEFTKDDLVFLYELNNSIEGFGYEADPRIEQLQNARSVRKDLPIIFECKPEEIAYGVMEINENTKAYIGEWSVEVYKKMPETIDYLYEEFPEKKIFKKSIELTVKSPADYKDEIEKRGMDIDSYAMNMLNIIEPLEKNQKIDLISFSVKQLGFSSVATLEQINKRARDLGLNLCPPYAGPELRLAYRNQPDGEYLRIAMQPIAGPDGSPRIFCVNNNEGLLIGGYHGGPNERWFNGDRFAFALRK